MLVARKEVQRRLSFATLEGEARQSAAEFREVTKAASRPALGAVVAMLFETKRNVCCEYPEAQEDGEQIVQWLHVWIVAIDQTWAEEK